MAKYIDNQGFAHFLGKLKTLLDGKVNTESGKGLSTNDYTTEEKNKLAGIAASANNYSLPTASSSTKGGVKVGNGLSITDAILSVDIPNAQETSSGSGTYMSGLMSGADKAKLDGISANANNYSLPTASADTKGGVKIGAGLTMTGEVLSADVQSVNGMTGATSSAAGAAGTVPAPAAGDQAKYLRGDGTWSTPTNTDEKVDVAYNTTTKATLLAVTNWPASSDYTLNSKAVTDPGVYLDTTAGKLTATSFSGSGSGLTSLNGSNISSGTVAAARIDSLPASKITSGTFDVARIPDLSATYALKSDITSMYKHKGSVSSTSNLPSSGQTAGDVYNVTATGMNYVWTGSDWDALGEVFTIDSMTTTEIDAAFVTAGLVAAA